MAEIVHLAIAGTVMRGAEGLRLGPGFERRVVGPDRVRGIERVVLSFRPLQQMKFDEARHLLEMRVTRQPHLLEIRLGAPGDTKTIHGDVHADLLRESDCLSPSLAENAGSCATRRPTIEQFWIVRPLYYPISPFIGFTVALSGNTVCASTRSFKPR